MKKNQKTEIKKQLGKEVKIIAGTLLLVLAVAFGFFAFSGKKDETASAPAMAQTNGAELIRPFNHKQGPDNAPVKVVEFYDPECEGCAAFNPYVKAIFERYGDKVQLIVRYTLFHGNSELAAKASEAAARQGKFWEFHELLFTAQHEWSHKQFPANEYFEKYAKDLSMDVEKFKADMKDLSIMENIAKDMEEGAKLGVRATPTFFINGKILSELSPNNFYEAIESELRK